jgi:DNA-binding NtrC family response regulator
MNEKAKILVVEDDYVDQIALERFIEKERLAYDCTFVGSVASAKEAWQSQSFDLVLSDFQLPDGDGLDIVDLAGDTPTVVVTGAGNESIAVKAMKAGARDYLIKDIERNYLTVLPSTVQNAIERARMAKEREELIVNLRNALAEIRTLSGLLPMCAKCKKIRDDEGYWEHVEAYVQKHSAATFTHSYCPDCFDKLMADAGAQGTEEDAEL